MEVGDADAALDLSTGFHPASAGVCVCLQRFHSLDCAIKRPDIGGSPNHRLMPTEPDYSRAALARFIEFVVAKGLVNPSTAQGWRVATTQGAWKSSPRGAGGRSCGSTRRPRSGPSWTGTQGRLSPPRWASIGGGSDGRSRSSCGGWMTRAPTARPAQQVRVAVRASGSRRRRSRGGAQAASATAEPAVQWSAGGSARGPAALPSPAPRRARARVPAAPGLPGPGRGSTRPHRGRGSAYGRLSADLSPDYKPA